MSLFLTTVSGWASRSGWKDEFAQGVRPLKTQEKKGLDLHPV